MRESISELNATSAELSHEISDREAQLEEALAAAQLLRAEQSRLQESVETSSARLAAEAAAGRAARKAAAAREEALEGELRVEREAVAGAAAAVAVAATAPAAVPAVETAGITPPGEGDPEGAASLPLGDAAESDGGGGGGGGGEGEGGGSPASVWSSSTGRGGGQREGQSSGEPLAASGAGGAGKSAAAVVPGQPSARERELEEEVATLKAALDAARGVGSNGGRGGGGGTSGLGGKGSSLAVVLESGDIGGEMGWLLVACFVGPVCGRHLFCALLRRRVASARRCTPMELEALSYKLRA